MTLDFDGLPPLTETCTKCWKEVDGKRYTGGYGEDKHLCDCVDHERPTAFGKAVLGLVRTFLLKEQP